VIRVSEADVRDFAPVAGRRAFEERDVALRGVVTIGKTTSVSKSRGLTDYSAERPFWFMR
jgi:hypothetical protein